MKYLISFFYLLFAPILGFCEIVCEDISIETDYNRASCIFYGKYIKTDTFKNFYRFRKSPFLVDNFEVLRFYKGCDTVWANYRLPKVNNGNYLLSVRSFCNQNAERYRNCFEKGKYYLVYSYEFEGNLNTLICSRTREIKNNNFRVEEETSFTVPIDIGKDESEALIRLEKLANPSNPQDDLPPPPLTIYDSKQAFELEEKEAIIKQLQEERQAMSYKFIALVILLGFSFVVSLYFYLKKYP
ncbi:MAG: hypothetical protein ACKVTZ_11535 [Bacteroidia bacterium]